MASTTGIGAEREGFPQTSCRRKSCSPIGTCAMRVKPIGPGGKRLDRLISSRWTQPAEQQGGDGFGQSRLPAPVGP